MKKLSSIAAATAVAGLSALTAMPVAAASTTITTADFAEAIAAPGTATAKGITCNAMDAYCVLSDEYIFGEDIDFDTLGYALELSGNTKLDLGGYTLTGNIQTDFFNSTNATITNGSISGAIHSYMSTLTLSGLTLDGNIEIYRSTLNITDGTYVSDNAGAVIGVGPGSTVTISGGTFRNNVDGVAISAFNDEEYPIVINISGGSFFSAGWAAIDLSNENIDPHFSATGPVTLNVSGGDFKGAAAGLFVVDPSLNTVSLSGGTFTTTDAANGGAIVAYAGGTDGILGMLASGYSYTVNSDILEGEYGKVYIPSTTTVANGAATDNTAGAPNSGALDTTGAKTATASAAGILAAGFIALGSALGIKRATKKAKIIAIDKERLSLSMKQLKEDPWLSEVEGLKKGSKVEGTVTRITPFGAFVQISPAVEALVHVSELGEGNDVDPEKVFTLNERKEFKVLDIDREGRKISLTVA